MDSKDILNLQEAYLEVVENQQLNESSIRNRAKNAVADDRLDAEQENTDASMNRLRRQNKRFGRALASDAARKVERDVKKSHSYGPQRPKPGTVTGRRIEDPKPTGSKPTGYRTENVDIYDIILSHLLDEGYAETPEAAEAIMVNMSEEWREDIMEGYKRYPAKKVGNKLDRMYDDPDTNTRFGKTGERYSQMRTVDSHMKGEVHPLIRAHSPKKSKAKETENRKRGENG
jgi:hypothetical protein